MPFTSKNRICSVLSSLGEDVLHLQELRGREALSEPFRFEVALVSEDDSLSFDALVGSSLCIRLSLDGARERFIHGRVVRFAQSVASERYAVYHATLVPWLGLLKRSSDCRIFQQRSVPQILAEVFRGLGLDDFELELAGSYEPREHVTQYRETDFSFVSRLMEEAGISYYFRHTEKGHTLVIFDASARALPCPGQPEAPFVTSRDASLSPGTVDRWHFEREFRPGSYALSDYSFAEPGLDLQVDAQTRSAVGGNQGFELYDYPGGYATRIQGADVVRLRMEEEEASSQRIHGRSTCEAFAPGYRFDLRGHHRTSFDAPYLITSVEHSVAQVDAGADGLARQIYENRFTCLEHGIPWRTPRRTPRPRIQGVQTAIVVGEPGREIDIDEQGRVHVQFHWDRHGSRDARSSCRVRVSQAAAGKGFGSFSAPRIGQEVIVGFVEGDPDQPIVTGRVYNGEQLPPYRDASHSGFRSCSTPGGDPVAGNEIRLEDAQGRERLLLRAARDCAFEIGASETLAIKENRTHTVGTNDALAVGAAQEIAIGGSQTIQVGLGQSVGIGASHTLRIGGSQDTDVSRDQKLAVGSSQAVQVARDASLTVGRKYVIDVGDELQIKVGNASITLQKNGDISIEGAKLRLKAAGELVLKGRKVAQN